MGDAGRAPSLDVAGFAPSEASLRTVIHGSLGLCSGWCSEGTRPRWGALLSVGWRPFRNLPQGSRCADDLQSSWGSAVPSDPPPGSGSPLPGHAQHPAFPCPPEAWASSSLQPPRPALSCLLSPILGLGPQCKAGSSGPASSPFPVLTQTCFLLLPPFHLPPTQEDTSLGTRV